MSKIEPTHDNIFLFVLRDDADGYAKVFKSFKRKQPGERAQAWAEIESGKVEQLWDIAPPSQHAVGIDMTFSATQSCLVFMAISGSHSHEAEADGEGAVGPYHNATTYFGKRIVRALDISGTPTASIIKDAKRHKLPGSGYYTVCSFAVDSVAVMREVGSTSGASTITRFPIVFDFVDSDDGRSPVFKKPDRAASPASAEGFLDSLGHGGIHPPSGSSLIILE